MKGPSQNFAQCRHWQSRVKTADECALQPSEEPVILTASVSRLFSCDWAKQCTGFTSISLIIITAWSICAVTYFGSFFVFDGDLTLVFAVADVSQLVFKQIGCCHRHRHEEQRKGSSNAAHCATDPCHLLALFTCSALASSLIHYAIWIPSALNASGARSSVTHSIITHAPPHLPAGTAQQSAWNGNVTKKEQ